MPSVKRRRHGQKLEVDMLRRIGTCLTDCRMPRESEEERVVIVLAEILRTSRSREIRPLEVDKAEVEWSNLKEKQSRDTIWS